MNTVAASCRFAVGLQSQDSEYRCAKASIDASCSSMNIQSIPTTEPSDPSRCQTTPAERSARPSSAHASRGSARTSLASVRPIPIIATSNVSLSTLSLGHSCTERTWSDPSWCRRGADDDEEPRSVPPADEREPLLARPIATQPTKEPEMTVGSTVGRS